MFDKTRARVDTMVNDRVTQPVRTSIVISCTAFILAALALAIVIGNADH
jgi:hypothetical protein